MKRSIGLLEMKNIAKGILAADAMLKAANVELLFSQPVCPGKYLAMIAGDVGAVQSAVQSGQAACGKENVVDEFVLPNVHPAVFPALGGCSEIKNIKSLGVIESYSVASAIVAADTAAKAAAVQLIEVRLARGMGGKSVVLLTGEVDAVQTAVQAGTQMIKDSGFLVEQVVIAAPHHTLRESIL